jgi:hypothetical protein
MLDIRMQHLNFPWGMCIADGGCTSAIVNSEVGIACQHCEIAIVVCE